MSGLPLHAPLRVWPEDNGSLASSVPMMHHSKVPAAAILPSPQMRIHALRNALLGGALALYVATPASAQTLDSATIAGFKWRTVASSLDHVGFNELDLPVVETSELLENLSTEYKARRLRLVCILEKHHDCQQQVRPTIIVYLS